MFIPITKDECFYNFKCLRPMSGLLPFNSVLSNISYVGAGFNASSSHSCLTLVSHYCHLSFTPFDWTFTGVLFLVCVSLRNLKRRKVLEGFPSSAAKLG